MKQLFLVIALIVSSIAGFGCSASSSNSVEAEASNSAESPFAHITDANAAMAEGDRLLDENQTQMAIEAYRQAVKLNPDLADAHFKLGITYALLERQIEQSGEMTAPASDKSKPNSIKAFEKAVEAYKKWLDANPTDHAAQFNLGRTYSKLLKDEEAEKAFKQAVKLKPDDSEYQMELGAVLIKLAQYHEAIAPLKKSIELDATNVKAQELLEDAQAGRQRVDYVSPKKDANQANSNQAANSNANMSSNSNSNSATRPPPANTNPKKDETKDKKPKRPE